MIYPYKNGSQSAKLLSEALGVRRIKLEGSKFKGSESKIIINWGASSVSDEVKKCKIINEPEVVAMVSNKLKFFEAVKGNVNIPEFTTNKDEAKEWIDAGKIVVVREKLTGHSGEGIWLLEDIQMWEEYNHGLAKMYVKYVPKKDEFRVHVVGGNVIDIRRKALRNDVNKEHANWKVRNFDNGFIFAKEGFEAPNEVTEESIKAIEASGLDFGAVDVVWNNYQQKAYVLEINTAPGLEGSSVDNYAAAFEVFYKADEDRAKAWEEFKKPSKRKNITMNDVLVQQQFLNVNDFQPVAVDDAADVMPEGYAEQF